MADPTACDCAECAAYPPPRRKAQPGRYGPPIAWRGRWYGLMPEGYYRNSKTGLLHRMVWQAHHGPLPGREIQVHHIDHDRSHNRIGNLEALTALEHERKHRKPVRGVRAWTFERRSEHARQTWSKRQPRRYRCTSCGIEFYSVSMQAKFCNRVCRRRYYSRVRGY